MHKLPQAINLLIITILLGATPMGVVIGQMNRGDGMVAIPAGKYVPLYGNDTLPVKVDAFAIDQYPVTNADFREFVKEYPKWARDNVQPVFADQNYLKQFTENNAAEIADKPATHISWFAAKAYCECQGKRLPSVDEWEYVGMASKEKPNGYQNNEFYQRILDWYSKPGRGKSKEVNEGFENYYGVYGMHGLVWEWVMDFNSELLVGESRADTGLDRNLFCAGGAVGVTDSRNYVAFMRYAFRSSLKANYTVANLGFRCAADLNN